MSHKLLITISNRMYATLSSMADETSLSIAELCRRSFDTNFGEHGEKTQIELTFKPGRRPGKRIP
jgi:hypothetical protein